MLAKPHYRFLLLAITFGISFALLMPPFQVPDEMTHFFRSYQVAEGHWLAQREGPGAGGRVPQGLWNPLIPFNNLPGKPNEKVKADCGEYLRLWRLPLDRETESFVGFPNTATYSPFCYLPQALGLAIGNHWNVSALALMYLGRFFNLLFWVALVFLSILITPVHKWAFTLLALTPMSLHQAASLSADAPTNGLCFLYIAFCLYLAYGPNLVLDKKKLALFLILTALVATSKQVYLPLALLAGLIPISKFASKSRFALFLSATAIVGLSAFSAWSYLVRELVTPMGKTFDPPGQVHFVLHHPFYLFRTVLHTYLSRFFMYVEQFLGQLGWLETSLPKSLLRLIGLALVAVALLDKDPRISITAKNKGLIVTSLAATFMTIATALYITWNPIGAHIVEGIQGRYFIGISPLVLLLFYNHLPALEVKPKLLGWIGWLPAATLFWSALVVLKRYYVHT